MFLTVRKRGEPEVINLTPVSDHYKSQGIDI